MPREAWPALGPQETEWKGLQELVSGRKGPVGREATPQTSAEENSCPHLDKDHSLSEEAAWLVPRLPTGPFPAER